MQEIVTGRRQPARSGPPMHPMHASDLTPTDPTQVVQPEHGTRPKVECRRCVGECGLEQHLMLIGGQHPMRISTVGKQLDRKIGQRHTRA